MDPVDAGRRRRRPRSRRAPVRRGRDGPTPSAAKMSALAAAICPLCDRVFGDEAALAVHCGGMLPEADDEPYYCSCGSVFCSPVALAEHGEVDQRGEDVPATASNGQ